MHTHKLLFSQAQYRLPATMADTHRAFDCRYMLQKNLVLFACNCSKKKITSKRTCKFFYLPALPSAHGVDRSHRKTFGTEDGALAFSTYHSRISPPFGPFTPSSSAATFGPLLWLRSTAKKGKQETGTGSNGRACVLLLSSCHSWEGDT